MNAPFEPDADKAAAAGEAPALPLAGVRVLDLTQVMAGPFATMLLGDLGADIIKIEPPGAGDQTRGAMGFKMKGSDSMGFLNLNRNKRSLALNLKSPAGREILYKLVETADILIENYRPGVMKRLGCDYETLRKINPQLVYASISGFGQTGPWAARPGYDLMAQAMAGRELKMAFARKRWFRRKKKSRDGSPMLNRVGVSRSANTCSIRVVAMTCDVM